jgi:hypothetical protein
MTGDALDVEIGRREPTIEFVSEQYVREFALAIGRPLIIGVLALEVVEVDLAALVCAARLGDDAGPSSVPVSESSNRPVSAKCPK